MNRAVAVLVYVLIALPCTAGDTTWQFLRVRRDLDGATSYVPTTGTAKVSIDEAKIHIEAFGNLGPKEPELTFDGTIDESGAIRATATLMHTDARPYTVTGRLHSWSREENWAGQAKIVTFHEITFPFDPNFELYAFLSKEARDK
jgi:hypothetical protein